MAALTRDLKYGGMATLSLSACFAAGVGAGGSLFFPDLLGGTEVTIGNLRGTAFVVLVLGVPLLLAGLASTRRGSARGAAMLLGAHAYLLYQGVLFCFATPFNALFLSYVAMLGLALWSLIALFLQLDVTEVARQVHPAMPYRAASVTLALVVIVNWLVWMARVVPATVAEQPSDLLEGSGLLTSPVYVQDLAFWLPAGLVVAALTWSRTTWGALLATGLLTFYVVEVLSVASDQWWGARADDSHPDLASMSVVPAAILLAAVIAIPAALCLRRLGPQPAEGTTPPSSANFSSAAGVAT
ncbi:MAG TPA: hypothetical protein VFK41_00510 [Nocardioidaceae bacterium]|nr:hypothetical protein [Nocardioidaceae bacterium]